MAKTHVMVDLETLGLRPCAQVLSIGAVVFDVDRDLGDTFYAEINPEDYSGSVDMSTLKFWFKEAAKGNLPPMDGTYSLGNALAHFFAYLKKVHTGDKKDLHIWCQGTDFDIPKLQHLAEVVGMKLPWEYNNVRDCRTIFKQFGHLGIKPDNIAKHNALDDAEYQARYLISILRVLEEKEIFSKEFN